MPEVSFPGDGHDGEQPPPAVPARDETAGTPADGRPDGTTDAPGDGHAGGDPPPRSCCCTRPVTAGTPALAGSSRLNRSNIIHFGHQIITSG